MLTADRKAFESFLVSSLQVSFSSDRSKETVGLHSLLTETRGQHCPALSLPRPYLQSVLLHLGTPRDHHLAPPLPHSKDSPFSPQYTNGSCSKSSALVLPSEHKLVL